MKTGIALSGGGTRAAAFHLGFLLRLANENLLEKVVRISTVSGGSIVTALIFTHNGFKWPTSREFREKGYQNLRRLLTTTDLFSLTAILAEPSQWALLPLHRGKVIANLLERRWGTQGYLHNLPDTPEWLINTTCIETGKNWRFSKFEMGDWKFGRHYNPNIKICEAVAASAAVPYAINSVKIKLPSEGWCKTNPATSQPTVPQKPPLCKVHLWDGGAYENLGIEPLYKPDRKMINCENIIVSDASGWVDSSGQTRGIMNLFKGGLYMPRLFDITSDQIRSLRSRMFVDALISGKAKGALIKIGTSVKSIYERAGKLAPTENFQSYQQDHEVAKAHKQATTLKAFSTSEFDLIARHGFECTDATLNAYNNVLVSNTVPWQGLPQK